MLTLIQRLLIVVAVALTTVGPFAAEANPGADVNGSLAMDATSASTFRTTSMPFLFSVYPVGGNGEIGNAGRTDASATLDAIRELRGTQPFAVHLFTAWSWYDEAQLDAEIARYTDAGIWVTLTIKYSPPAGREGDVNGFAAFARTVVKRHATNPYLFRFVIGNEGNITWGNPESSDGPFAGVNTAIVRGTIAARSQLTRSRSQAQVGINYAITSGDGDEAYLRQLVSIGGWEFQRAVGFVGINVYPGLWPEGSGDPYADMAAYLHNTRAVMTSAGFGSNVTIDVLENGFPTADEHDQASRLDKMVRAVLDNRESTGVSGYSWFGLLDADSSSSNRFAHYGLLRSDMSHKPAFDQYRQLIATTAGLD